MLSITQKLLVAAIDIGTDNSGYASSFSHEYNKNPARVNMNIYSSGKGLSFKQPTCVLCNPAGQFNSFGYEAENKYSELSEVKEHYNWYFFRKFIDMLSEKQVNMGIELTDEKGMKMPAIKVFSMAIRYNKDCLIHRLKLQGQDVSQNDIHWVLPVPATWTVSAKDFLREAAKEAGIDGAKLTIALEPHAAAMYCQLLPSDHLLCGGRFEDDKYMVIDLGDSKSVFTVHEKQPNGIIKYVHEASGGPWGSNTVDEEFTQMIIKIVGKPTFKKFCDDYRGDHLDILRELEVVKGNIRPDTDNKIVIHLPQALKNIFQEIYGKTVQNAVEQSPYKGKLTLMGDKIRLDAELFRSFFKNSISNITNHIKNLCQKPGVKGTSTFLMIGKFSEFQLVQEAVKKSFPKVKVVIPMGPELAVLKGAVALGHKLSLTCDYNFQLQQPTNKDHSAVATTFAKQDEDDVASDDYANGSTCSNSYAQDFRNDQITNLKYKSESEEGEDALSSDFLEMRVQTQDKVTRGLETPLENQMTLEADNTRVPSDDELFALSRQLNKVDKEWWLLAKLLGLSDKQIYEIEHGEGGAHIVRKYYTMLTAWKGHNTGQEKGTVRYLLRKCDEAGIDRKVTDTVFGN